MAAVKFEIYVWFYTKRVGQEFCHSWVLALVSIYYFTSCVLGMLRETCTKEIYLIMGDFDW